MRRMTWLRSLMMLAGLFLVTGTLSVMAEDTAPAVPATTNAAPTVDPAKARAEFKAKMRKYQGLARRLDPLIKAKKYAEEQELLLQMIAIMPDDPDNWYNLACAQSCQSATNEAIQSLTRSVEKGWSDFRFMELDKDLTALRSMPEYRKLLRRREEIQEKRAEAIRDQLVKQLGKEYLIGIDHDLRLVYATNVDQRTLDEMTDLLSHHARALQNDLFEHGFEQYVTVIIPKEWKLSPVGGYYEQEQHVLQAENVGATLRHEFTHALHFADQNARGQEHAYWVIEGLSSLYESSEIHWGHAVPQANHRLVELQDLVKEKKTVPWAKFMKFSPEQFMRGMGDSYCQTRYMLFYLYATKNLRKWYDAYVEGFDEDPTGAKAMEKVFGKDLAAIEKDWLDWVAKLPTPRTQLDTGHASLGITTGPEKDGIRIEQVIAGAGAARAGLAVGDVITKVDGDRIHEPEQLLQVIGGHAVGDKVRIDYRRDGKYDRVRVTLTPLPTPEEAKALIEAAAKAGESSAPAPAKPSAKPEARPDAEKKDHAG